MSENWIIAHVGLIVAIVFNTVQVWSAFKSTDKVKEALITVTIGGIISIIYLCTLLALLGAFTEPLIKITEILYFKINVITLIIFTISILFTWKFTKILISVIGRGKLVSTNKNQKKRKVNKKTKIVFYDTLEQNIVNWHTISGNPQISQIRGLNSSNSLLLEEFPSIRTDTFVTPNKISLKSGKISCDVYLERDAVFNIVVGADPGFTNFIMARIDSRTAGSNGILKANQSNNWGYIEQPNTYVLHDQWYHVEIIFEDKKYIKLLLDGKTLISKIDINLRTDGYIGIFNEIKRVFVNNFSVYK